MRTVADSVELHCRDTTTVTADAACVAHGVLIAEYTLGRSEVKGGEGA